MRFALALSLCVAVLAPAVHAESKNPADYPLRIQLVSRNQTSFMYNRQVEEARGEGRLNLFENGEAHGVDFTFECDEKLKFLPGMETYPAKWKKPGQELTVLMPVFGKTGQYFTCTFKTDVKPDIVYIMQNGRLNEMPVAQYKVWMTRHDYDPEHGKNTPKRDPAVAAPTRPAAAPQQ